MRNIFKRKRYIPLPEEQESGHTTYDDSNDQNHPKYSVEHLGVDLVGIPFEGVNNEVIYMEDRYNEDVNKCIRENYDLIKDCFAKRDLRFVYLPWIGKEISDNK